MAHADASATEWEVVCDAERHAFEHMGMHEVMPCPKAKRWQKLLEEAGTCDVGPENVPEMKFTWFMLTIRSSRYGRYISQFRCPPGKEPHVHVLFSLSLLAHRPSYCT